MPKSVIQFLGKEENSIRYYIRDDIRVNSARYGKLDVTKPWFFALVWIKSRYFVLLLREMGDGYERVSIVGLNASDFNLLVTAEGKDSPWAYIILR